jgi:hypothetical protein
MMLDWFDVNEHPMPPKGVILVWLKEPMLNSYIRVSVRHPNVNSVGGHFEFDAPKIVAWACAPLGPQHQPPDPREEPHKSAP